jgi:hypothetical protein
MVACLLRGRTKIRIGQHQITDEVFGCNRGEREISNDAGSLIVRNRRGKGECY